MTAGLVSPNQQVLNNLESVSNPGFQESCLASVQEASGITQIPRSLWFPICLNSLLGDPLPSGLTQTLPNALLPGKQAELEEGRGQE